jgi:hypothetical protein
MQTPLASSQLRHPPPTTGQLLVRVPTLPQDHHHATEGEASMSGDHNMHQGDCYGDGTVYRGQRSANSTTKTYTVEELARAKGVPEVVGSAMIAISKDCMACQEKLHTLEHLTKRMALDLECMILNPTGWYNSAQDSLQAYQDLMDAWYPQDYVSPLGKD